MNTTLLSGGIALALGSVLVAAFGLLALLNGALDFFFAGPRIVLLKSREEGGLAFALEGGGRGGAARFDTLTVRLFNPFGSPTQREVSAGFEPAAGGSFARDVPLGPGLAELLGAEGFGKATVAVQVKAGREGVLHSFEMRGREFQRRLEAATLTATDYAGAREGGPAPPYLRAPPREFIEPPGGAGKVLKIPDNPAFPDFLGLGAAAAGAEASPGDNFQVKKVWIDPGCIVCDACEGIYPEVFEVRDDTCVIRPDAPLDNGALIEEAADACPVEVIKFERA